MVNGIVCIIAVIVVLVICDIEINHERKQRDKERLEWYAERKQLLDRIQAGSFVEYKIQERADTAPKREKKERDPLDKEPFL